MWHFPWIPAVLGCWSVWAAEPAPSQERQPRSMAGLRAPLPFPALLPWQGSPQGCTLRAFHGHRAADSRLILWGGELCEKALNNAAGAAWDC